MKTDREKTAKREEKVKSTPSIFSEAGSVGGGKAPLFQVVERG